MTKGRHTTTGTLPTREFLFALDPDCVPQISDAVCEMVHGLAHIEPPLRITFGIPYHFIPITSKEIERFGDAAGVLTDLPFVEQFTLDPQYPTDAAQNILQGDNADQHKALLGSADHIQADGLVTARPIFLDQHYLLYQHHAIVVIDPDELFDFINVCAIGHSIFWPDTFRTHDIFYLETHWKLRRYKKWFFKINARIENQDLSEELRSLVLSRLPFLIYSRDMVRFHQIQRDYYTRRGRVNRFAMAIAYHLNHYFLLLWGLLDHLTVIANYALGLNVPMVNCGIQQVPFWGECQLRCPALFSVIKEQSVDEWIKIIADIRHRAAHRTLPTPRPLYRETEESSRPKEEVRGIVLKENRDILERASATSNEAFEWMVEAMIDEWRFEHAELVSETMVLVRVTSF